MSDWAADRKRLVGDLRAQGIVDHRVLAAFSRVPREQFVPDDLRELAYRDAAIPIAEGQTTSQPFVIALMLQELRLDPGDRVLEIGTGSGYQSAILAELCQEVVSVELLETLASQADERLRSLGYRNVLVHRANGSLGWPPGAPYDAIVVSAAAPDVPQALLDQLAEGGRLILPVGTLHAQELILVERRAGELRELRRGAVRFVPLLGEQGWGG